MLQKVLYLINKCALKPNPLTNKWGIGVSAKVQLHGKQKVHYRIRAAGFNKNFNRKGGGDNGEQPMEGMGRVVLLYTEYLPGEASGWRGSFTPEAGRRSAVLYI